MHNIYPHSFHIVTNKIIELMFESTLKSIFWNDNMCLRGANIVCKSEVLHMNDDERKKQDIKFIVELLQNSTSDKVRNVLVFIRSYLSK